MTLRLDLHALADGHDLNGASRDQLLGLAGLHDEPPALAKRLPLGLAVLAATLFSMGLIMWVAANWADLGRMGRFAILLGWVLVTGLAAAWRPAWRVAMGLLALMGVGALFAYFGQTYQTGADPWQLFALWAALGLPLCLGARSDVLWTPWAGVSATGIALWADAVPGNIWRLASALTGAVLPTWLAALLVVAVLSAPLRPFTGAGVWSFRTAATLAVALVTASGVLSLIEFRIRADEALVYGLSLVVLGAAAVLLWRRATFDLVVLSATALGLNVVLMGGLFRILLKADAGGIIMLGLVAAGLLGATVNLILKRTRQLASADGAQHG